MNDVAMACSTGRRHSLRKLKRAAHRDRAHGLSDERRFAMRIEVYCSIGERSLHRDGGIYGCGNADGCSHTLHPLGWEASTREGALAVQYRALQEEDAEQRSAA